MHNSILKCLSLAGCFEPDSLQILELRGFRVEILPPVVPFEVTLSVMADSGQACRQSVGDNDGHFSDVDNRYTLLNRIWAQQVCLSCCPRALRAGQSRHPIHARNLGTNFEAKPWARYSSTTCMSKVRCCFGESPNRGSQIGS